MKFAIIENDEVRNLVIADSIEDIPKVDDLLVVEATDSAFIGGKYLKGKFISAEVHEYTVEELEEIERIRVEMESLATGTE